MKKYHVHTTLSQKHMELLRKLSEKYDTQQKVLELALESFANESKRTPELTKEMEFWMRIGSNVGLACMIQREGLKDLMRTADAESYSEFVRNQNPVAQAIEYYWQKSAEVLTLKEIVEGFLINLKVANWFDMVDHSDDGDHYTIKLFHSLGLNNSLISQVICESTFNSFGYKCETSITDRSLFVKINKNSNVIDVTQKLKAHG